MLRNAIEKGKTGLIIFLIGGVAGIGLALWISRRKKKASLQNTMAGVEDYARQVLHPRTVVAETVSSRPAAQPQVMSFDDEVIDPSVDFDDGGEF